LKAGGFRIYLETNGTLPEDLAKVMPVIDIISMDIKLPDINGIAVMERCKGLDYSPTIVAMTGFSDQQVIDKILSSGADRCITKPFNVDDIFTIIRETADHLSDIAAEG